jgi:pilus assembly protein CpaC
MDRSIRKNLEVTQGLTTFNSGRISFITSAPSATLTAFATGGFTNDLLGPTSFAVLERQGLVKTLAEPTLTALSGQTASFLSGGRVSIVTTTTSEGTATEQVTYEDVGIQLEFTPTVVDENRVNLHIKTEIRALDSNLDVGTNVGFSEKSTETTIDLPSGGSLMIAGLLQDDMTNTVSGIPYLKDIPVLGALFRSHEFLRDETELVVTVTIYLAKPTGADTALALPTDGFEPASDIDLYLLGRLHREYTKKELPIWAAPLKGPFGYIME